MRTNVVIKGKREKREKVSGLIPNKSGLDPDKTGHNARGNHEGC